MKRLYYNDSYTTSFEAELVERTTYQDIPACVLSQTYFYPTSGGQPNDSGVLNGIPVIDVVIRELDGAVLHILGGPLPDGVQQIRGEINWARRFDHMQHHTGQHILSQAFIKTAGAETISFHLSPDSVTIDLNKSALSPEDIDAAEDLANQIIEENRAVQAWYPTEEEREALHLRKVPDVEGRFRVVAIDGFDATACGGTHVGYTGEIGLVKVIKADRRGDTIRVEFRCGKRALHDYREKNALLNQLSAELTTGYWEVPAALERLREQNKAQQRELKALKTALLESEATQLWQTADRSAGYALILHAFEGRDASEVRQIAQQLVTHPATVVLCGAAGEKSQLIAARSEDLPYDMVPVLMRGLLTLGVERGGGRPSFAQGGGIAATQADVQAALLAAAKTLSSNA